MEVSGYKPRFDQQMMVYSYHQVIDISQFSKYKTMELHIPPRAEFGKNKYFKFERELLLDGQPVKDRKIADKVIDIYSDLDNVLLITKRVDKNVYISAYAKEGHIKQYLEEQTVEKQSRC